MQNLLQPPMVQKFVRWIDRWSFFQNTLHITGYAFSSHQPTVGVRLVLSNDRAIPLSNFRIPSADLTIHWGRAAAACRFDERVLIPEGEFEALNARLEFTFLDGSVETISDRMPEELADPIHQLLQRFIAMLREMPHGHILELGSRNRTGNERRHYVPEAWQYTGTDIVDGPNVDIVGDAHEVSALFPHNSFDAMMSFAVFEHLMMPWKAAVELNKVLKTGGIGLILAPHTWPLHEEPCDYFRFSRHSWKSLFNKYTGFEIVDSTDGSPAFIVAQRLSAASAWTELYRGALMSGVIFRKTGNNLVDWPVSLKEIANDDQYPF